MGVDSRGKGGCIELNRRSIALGLAATVVLLLPAAAQGAEGDLDQSFGAGGKVITPIGPSTDQANAMAIDSQGRIVVAGQAFNGTTALTDFALARYEENGSLDAGFGSGGTVITGFGTKTDDSGRGVAIDSQGRIVVVGLTFDGADFATENFAIARYTPDGTLDTSFNGTGKVTQPIGTRADNAGAVAIDAQDRIVVAGVSDTGSNSNPNNDFALARFNPNGSLDTSFNGSGKVITSFGTGSDAASAVAIDAQGRIVVAGKASNGTENDFALARYNPNGTLDTTFNATGKAVTAFTPGGFDRAAGVALD